SSFTVTSTLACRERWGTPVWSACPWAEAMHAPARTKIAICRLQFTRVRVLVRFYVLRSNDKSIGCRAAEQNLTKPEIVYRCGPLATYPWPQNPFYTLQQDCGFHESQWYYSPRTSCHLKNMHVQGVSMYDDSEHKQGAEELQSQEARYRRLIKNIPEVVWTADEQGNALFISEKIENVFGYSSEEVLRQGAALWFGRMHPEDLGHVQDAYATLFKAGRPYDVEYRIQHRDGRWMWWRDRAVITEQAREKRYADGLLSDVTEQKNLEIQLRQAQKMEAVGQLAGGIAHDFNNLLCVLQGHTELAKEQVEHNPELLRHMEVIAESAKRATSLIQQLLAFSRKQVLRATVIDLNVTVACIQKFLSRVIGENIELITRFQIS